MIWRCLNDAMSKMPPVALQCESPRRVVGRARSRDAGRVAPALLHLGRERQVS